MAVSGRAVHASLNTDLQLLNLVERSFAELTEKWIKRVRDLVALIRTWIANWNKPAPYVWHETADEILSSLADYCQRVSHARHYVCRATRS